MNDISRRTKAETSEGQLQYLESGLAIGAYISRNRATAMTIKVLKPVCLALLGLDWMRWSVIPNNAGKVANCGEHAESS